MSRGPTGGSEGGQRNRRPVHLTVCVAADHSGLWLRLPGPENRIRQTIPHIGVEPVPRPPEVVLAWAFLAFGASVRNGWAPMWGEEHGDANGTAGKACGNARTRGQPNRASQSLLLTLCSVSGVMPAQPAVSRWLSWLFCLSGSPSWPAWCGSQGRSRAGRERAPFGVL